MLDSLTWSVEKAPEAAEVAELFRAAGLRRPVDDLPRIARMIAGADLILCARDTSNGGRLAGLARTITDYAYCSYVSDLAVHPDYQRRGIGRELLRRTREALGPEVATILIAAPTALDYYGHVGFEHNDHCWMIPRER